MGLVSSLSVAEADTPANLEFAPFDRQHREQRLDFDQSVLQRLLSTHQYQSDSVEVENKTLDQQCLPYKGLRFRGVKLVDHRSFVPTHQHCLNEESLNKLSRDLTQAYLKQGYFHTPFHFEADRKNRLVMVVKEGKTSKLSTESKRINFKTLLPNAIGKPLKIYDLDQALDQANRMNGSQVTVDVLPYENGDIELNFANDEQNRITGFIGIDNFADKHYHRWQNRLGLNIDSPLGLSDTINLTAAHTLDGLSEYQRSASLYYGLPYGYWNFDAFAAVSEYRRQIPLQSDEVEQRGRTIQTGIGANYTFHRGSNHISSLSLNLERIDSKQRFADTVLALQSPKLTAYKVGFNHLQLFPQGALNIEVNYKHGLKWFNALPNQGKDQPEGQYGKWQADIYYQQYHQWQGEIFRQSHQLALQHSRNYLPAIEQADLTGRYAVRGLQKISYSAEKSAILRNSLAWQKSFKKVQIEPYVALDIGAVKNSSDDVSAKRALSYALGMSIAQSKQWNAQIEWARGHFKADQKQASIKGHSLDFTLRLNF